MGARRRGDIKTLCEIVKPDIGIITGICAQHLETFGSLENVKMAKKELIEGLPVRGQRTKTNARTRKGPVKTIANKKK